MYNANTAPEVVSALPAQKEVAHHHQQVGMEPVPMAYAQERVPASSPSTAYPSSSQTYYPHMDGHSTTTSTPGLEKPSAGSSPICGLTQRNFMILCIAALVILGAAIGGGVGGGLVASRAESNFSSSQHPAGVSLSSSIAPAPTSSPVSTTTPSSPSSSATGIAQQDVQLDCPNIDGKKETFDKKWTFRYNCGKDYTGSQYDIIFLASYRLEDCVKACTSYNNNRGRAECTAVEFNADMKACAVKNATSDIAMNAADPTRQVLAVLQL
ncbi:uncharacterized protein PG998_012056 [Apiospora kogelbergensis]|uniref:uncharacterized protein n=1 Tax=Apiospora kogelbergensis TaxID=1337665 RepID=UPI00312D8CD7